MWKNRRRSNIYGFPPPLVAGTGTAHGLGAAGTITGSSAAATGTVAGRRSDGSGRPSFFAK